MAKTMVYSMRVNREDRRRWQQEAKRQDRKLSAFITLTMNARCRDGGIQLALRPRGK